MMTENQAISAAINIVPQWTYDNIGSNKYEIKLNSESIYFYSFRPLTPLLDKLYHSIKSNLPQLFDRVKGLSLVTGFEVIQEFFILEFLKRQNSEINWGKVIDYEKTSSKRTYENQPLSFNIIFITGDGGEDIFDSKIQKYFDPLTNSNWAYLVLDYNLNYIDYRQISWDSITEPKTYQFYPEFLQPYMNVNRNEKSYSIHKTKRGDFIVLDQMGLIAAKRKGQWKAYDSPTLKNSLSGIVGKYWVGANLFEIVFDLSFKRHGALLIFDPQNKILENIINNESIVSPPNKVDKARRILKSVAAKISLGDSERTKWNKSILLDLASIDGAIVFDEKKVNAIGAIIKSHPDASGLAGARTTAAVSAMKHGACAIKISADGEIVFYYKVLVSGNLIETKLEFL